MVQADCIRVPVGVGEVEVGHSVDAGHVDVEVWHFEASDHNADALWREHLLDRKPDSLGDGHQMGEEVVVDVEPVIDLDPRNDQRMTRGQGLDREERNAQLILVHESPREFSIDDAGEECRHDSIVSGDGAIGTVASQVMGRRFFLRSVVLTDVLLLVAAILLSTYSVFDVWAPWLVSTPTGSLMPSVILVLSGAGLSLYGSYLAWGRTVPRPSYGRAVAIVAATMAFTAVGLVVSRAYWSREWLITVAVLWFVFAIVARFIARRRPWTESMVIITSEKILADDIGNTNHADVIAIVDPLGEPEDVPLVDGGSLVVDLREVLSEDMARYVSSASVSGQRVRPLVEVYEEHTGRLPLVHIVGGWELSRPVQRSQYAGVKRAIDVVLVVLTLPLWLALWGAVWIVVKVDSPGPAIYSQRRVGRNGAEFTLYKFRTMATDAERDGPRFTSQDDPRITRTGRFLRKSRLDEVPQLWNVLRGELAIVGPRPERPVFVDQFSRTIPFYESRQLIRPGVTGWAQVHYGYADGEADTVEKLTYDLYYVKHSSLWMDVHVLGMSIWTVLTGTGAR